MAQVRAVIAVPAEFAVHNTRKGKAPMDVIIGRENISATVFVPYDCENRCNFCTTKHFYADLQPYEVTMENIAKNVRVLSRMGNKTVTINL